MNKAIVVGIAGLLGVAAIAVFVPRGRDNDPDGDHRLCVNWATSEYGDGRIGALGGRWSKRGKNVYEVTFPASANRRAERVLCVFDPTIGAVDMFIGKKFTDEWEIQS